MENGSESRLPDVLRAMQQQQTDIARQARKLLDRCHTEHADDHTSRVSDDAEMGVIGRDAASGHLICRPCYDDLLTLVHDTYAAPASPKLQWYSHNPYFLSDLDQQLESARSLQISLQDVDAWLATQKRMWVADQLLPDVAVQALGETVKQTEGGGGASYLASLASAKTGDDVFGELLRSWVTKEDRYTQDAVVAVQQLKAATLAASTLAPSSSTNAIYRDIIFSGGEVPAVPAARVLESKLQDSRMGLGQALREALESGDSDDDKDARAAKIEKNRKRLVELRRAKAAHEAQKLKRMKAVQVPYFLQEHTPCAHCGTASDPTKSPFCIVCFLEVDYLLRENQTVWCSTGCMKADYAAHYAAQHPCAAGDRCARAKPDLSGSVPAAGAGPGAGVVRQEPRYCFCRECVPTFNTRTVYCSDRCASRDFQRHRETVHLPHRALRADSRDDRGDLSYSSAAQVDYTAVDITKHVLPLAEALEGCQKKHPDWALAETMVRVTLPWST